MHTAIHPAFRASLRFWPSVGDTAVDNIDQAAQARCKERANIMARHRFK